MKTVKRTKSATPPLRPGSGEERVSLSKVGAFAVGSDFVEATLKRVGYKTGQTTKVRTASTSGAVHVDLLVSSEIDSGITVSLTKGIKTSPGKFPDVVAPKGSISAIYSGGIDGIIGTLNIAGMEGPVMFGAGVPGGTSTQPSNYIILRDKKRGVVINSLTGEWNSASSATSDTEGIAADIEISEGVKATIKVHIRKANQLEMRRWEAGKCLEDAEKKQDYASLLAQITKARARFVDVSRIEQAEKLLKTLKPAPEDVLTKEQLKSSMKWELVTKIPEGHSEELVQMCHTESCASNSGGAPMMVEGEELVFYPNAVEEAFRGIPLPDGVSADKFLFEELVAAAADAPEGCVWRAGGKFILSAPNRNQAPTALFTLLMNYGRGNSGKAAQVMKALVDYTERKYGKRVTAIQTNFHPNHESFHAQHRDIFSSKQRGGSNCTCSFHTCSGTVCYSLGSSRRILCETCVDEMSQFEACGDGCEPCKKWRWLESGSFMYFNDKWNNNHTHGIPPSPELPSGPRISIAFLMAA